MNIQIRTAPFGRGLGWITDGLAYFTKNPLGWIAAMIVVFLIMIVIGVIPLGGLLSYVIWPIFTGGLMLGCKAHAEGQQFEFQHAFAGFSAPYVKRLLLLGVILTVLNMILLIILMAVIFIALGGMDFLQQLQNMQPEDIAKYMADLSVLLLVASLLYLPILMCTWFAPALLVNTKCGTVQAMLLSFRACLYNVPAFTLYGIVIFVLGILATIPLGLGFLILLPVFNASVYQAYLDCFAELPATEGPAQVSTDS